MTIRAMFIQSQPYFGADSAIHGRLMRHYDRADVEVHVACTSIPLPPGPALKSLEQLRQIPDLHVRPTHFGPTFFGRSLRDRLRQAHLVPLGALDFVALAAYIRRHKIQILHGTEKPRDAVYAVALARLTGARSVVHLHVKYADWLSPGVKWALRNADAIVGVSEYVACTLTDAGYPADRVFGVGNSLDDLDRWDPAIGGAPARRQLGIPDDAPVIGMVARLFSWKGQGDLLEAAALVRRELPDLRVMIVGDDDPGAHPNGGSYRAELEAQARRLGITANVVFTGPREDVPQVLAAMDVFAMPSWEEPWGMAYLEAMAMERPVIAWRNGGVPEIVVQGETGLLVEPKDIPALATAIADLLRDPERRRRFGVAGRRRVAEVHTPQRMSREMVDVYRTTLARSAPAVHLAGAAGLIGAGGHNRDATLIER